MADDDALFARAARGLAALDESARGEAAAHARLPVTRGEKLIASRCIRQHRFEPAKAESAD